MNAPRDDPDREHGPGTPAPTNAAGSEPVRTLRDEDIVCERRTAGPAMARDALERVRQPERRRAAARSSLVWRRCAEAIDDALAQWLPAYDDAPVARVAEMLSAREAGAVIDARELEAALWAVLRRRDAVLVCVIARLAMEAEIAIARGYVHLAGTRKPSFTSRSWGPREPEHVRAVRDRELPVSRSPSGRGGPR